MKIAKDLNCPNCGAPITGRFCGYCGTEFRSFAELEDLQNDYVSVLLEISNAQADAYLKNLSSLRRRI